MKTLIMTVVMAVNAIAGVIAANVDSKFAYNRGSREIKLKNTTN